MKSIVEYFCNPDKYETCAKFQERPGRVDDDKVPVYWGILGIVINFASSFVMGNRGGRRFDSSIRGLGWSLQRWSIYSVWDPVLLFWFIRFFVKDNDVVNWLYVLFSNISMLGPVLIYWLSSLLILVGYAVDGFEFFGFNELWKWAFQVVVFFVASYYQEAWIDEIQDLYSGDNFTFEEQLEMSTKRLKRKSQTDLTSE